MDVSKEILGQYVFVIAHNAGLLTPDLLERIQSYDARTYADLLTYRAKELRARARAPQPEVDPSYYEESATTVERVRANLHAILR